MDGTNNTCVERFAEFACDDQPANPCIIAVTYCNFPLAEVIRIAVAFVAAVGLD